MKKKIVYLFWAIIIIVIGAFLKDQMQSLDPQGAQIQNIYSFLGDKYLDYCEGMPLYEDKEANFDNLSDEVKMCLAFKLLNEDNINNDTLDKVKKKNICTLTEGKDFRVDDDSTEKTVGCSVNVIDEKALSDAYAKIFGKKIQNTIDFNLSGSKICYFDEEGNRYVCGNTVVQNLQIGWAPTTYRLITKAKEKGNKIYLYEYFLAINNDKCYLTNTGSKENTKCSESIGKKTQFNDKFVKKHGQKYLHIFEKDSNGEYHWASSSLVK